jgi:glycosyltransferase involved in cell wall biosynthesis
MVIGVLARRIWTHGTGGMESHTRLLVSELARRGHTVHVVTTAIPGAHEAPPAGIHVHALPGTPPGDYSTEWWDASRAWGAARFAPLGIEAVLSVGRAGRAVLRVPRRPPFFAICHGYGWTVLRGMWHDRRGVWKVLGLPRDAVAVLDDLHAWRDILRTADGVFAGSRDLWQRLGTSRARYLPNVVDTTRFRPDAASGAVTRASLGAAEGDVVVLMVGTVNRQKGVLDGLRACAEVASRFPRLRAVVVGDGPALPAARAWAASVAPRLPVTFAGEKAHAGLPPYYALADVFLFPSRRHEVLPLTVLEAMATGLPVVATRVGGTGEAVRDGETGFLLRPGDRAAMIAALSTLAADRARRRAMGLAGRRLTEAEFDVRSVVGVLVEILEARRC